MSKKQLLTESEMRRFARLANIPVLGKNLVSEMAMPMEADEEPAATAAAPAGMDMGGMEAGGMEGGETVEVGGDVDPEKKQAFEAAVQALADAMGIDVELEGQEENAEEGGEEMEMDMDAEEGGEEESSEDEEDAEEDTEEDEEDEEEMQESEEKDKEGLSEDELVEAVLSRVTARLVAEAKKKKMSVKDRMKMKAKQKKEDKKDKKDKMEEATDSKGGGPLLSKGGNKHDVWKGHADMKMGKGEKGGSGGHKMEDLAAKSEHTVTHGGKNLATLGGNKKK